MLERNLSLWVVPRAEPLALHVLNILQDLHPQSQEIMLKKKEFVKKKLYL